MVTNTKSADTRRVVTEIYKLTGCSRAAIHQTANQLVGMGISESKQQALAYMLKRIRKDSMLQV